MKEIDIKNSLIFGRKLNDLKASIEHLSEEGYFSDFEDFSEYKEGVLDAVNVSNDSYYPYTNSYDCGTYKFFALKSQTVLTETKKYEPFIYKSELPFTVGDKIIFRAKNSSNELLALVNGIKYTSDDEQKVVGLILGCTYCDTIDLFNNYEILVDGEWQPFGVSV